MSDSNYLPPGSIVYGPDANCTLDLCPVEYSVYGYRPTLAGNSTILALFALSIIFQLVLGIRYRTWFFMGATILGSITEIVGYAGRLMLWRDPFSFNGFLMQIICITFAATFYAAAIYVTLAQTVQNLDPSISRFSIKLYYWIFIPCDVVSLVLQASGGGLSSSSSGVSQPAIDVSITGLAFQVFTMTVFVCLAGDYAVRYMRTHSRDSDEKVGSNRRLHVFVGFLTVAMITLYIRCCYRIFELSGGYIGPNIRDEGIFLALESSMILVTCYGLIVAHPGFVFKSKSKDKDSARA